MSQPEDKELRKISISAALPTYSDLLYVLEYINKQPGGSDALTVPDVDRIHHIMSRAKLSLGVKPHWRCWECNR